MGRDRKILRLRLKYCGGCNPEIDRVGIVNELARLLETESIKIQYVEDKEPFDLILLVNGCSHACKEEELNPLPASSPYLSVQGARLQHQPVSEDQIPYALFEKVKSLIG